MAALLIILILAALCIVAIALWWWISMLGRGFDNYNAKKRKTPKDNELQNL